ncbi:hypothetical protein [Flavobacterium cerinum]|uniref:Bacterial surface antigen (D15) domain-containing protein n=1 Tax=Flavobacterium cerinum TaxID=2502784 RepID=A0ABY5IVV7_9FLAO|nr:hypothetical protein [Flavobacterium cerinum]UUC46962.1 hypothetical protein NOX80_07115 [Flavobacterium cerinum]
MKKLFLFLFFLLLSSQGKAQNLYLKIEGDTPSQNAVIDSIGYQTKHSNTKSILEESTSFSSKLLKIGYLENNLTEQKKSNDSTFTFHYNIGKKTNRIHIYTGKTASSIRELLNIKNDTILINLSDVEDFMNTNIQLLEKKGYSLSSIQLTNHKKLHNELYAELKIDSEKKRILDDIIIAGYSKFPEGIRRNIVRQNRKRIFNQDNLKQIHSNFNALPFVNQIKYPEILFTTDSTKVYVYLEKAKPNRFDGFVGFSNDDNGSVKFNGYLDLLLNNILNSGEKFNLYWKNDGKEQTTFTIGTELPYLFKSPLGLKGNLKIFKQDSTFQNTSSDINLGYYFNYNSKVFLGYQQTESVDIQKANSNTLSNYNNSFTTGAYEYTHYNPEDLLFPEKTSFFLKSGIGSRKSKIESSDQYFIQLNASHNIYLNRRNIFNLRSQAFYLQSDHYIINELYRFGGINSIRGFNENSLQANLYSGLLFEYRYILASNIYVYSITDFAYFEDKITNMRDNLLGLGFGFGLLTKTGLFNIIYANGSSKNNEIQLSNSIIHISVKARF